MCLDYSEKGTLQCGTIVVYIDSDYIIQNIELVLLNGLYYVLTFHGYICVFGSVFGLFSCVVW